MLNPLDQEKINKYLKLIEDISLKQQHLREEIQELKHVMNSFSKNKGEK